MNVRSLWSTDGMIKEAERLGPIPSNREGYGRAFNMAWPSIVESVLMALVNLVDTMMVSGLGTGAVAAVGITNQPRLIVLALIFSLNVGVIAVVARRKGQGDREGANRCMKQCMLISTLISLVMAILCLAFCEPLMRFAGANEEYLQDACDYFRIIMLGIVFNALSLTINAAQRGAGNTKITMRSNMTANIVNIVLNYFLINGHWIFPRMEVKGAALATTIGFIVAFIMSFTSVCRRERQLPFLNVLSPYSWKWDKKTLGAVYKVASSAMVEQMFMRIGFFLYVKIVAALGTVAYATHQICMNVMNISFGVGDGFNAASSALVGQSLGAKRPDLAKLYPRINQRMAIVGSTILAALLIIFRYSIMGMFSNEQEVILLGGILIIMIACTTHAQTSAVIFSGSLRGAGDTKYVAMISMISIAMIRPVLAWALAYPIGFGLIGAWVAVMVDQYTRLTLFYLRFRSGKWTKIEL